MSRFDALEVSNALIQSKLDNNASVVTEILETSGATNNTIARLSQENNQLKLHLKIVMNKQLRLENEVQKLKETAWYSNKANEGKSHHMNFTRGQGWESIWRSTGQFYPQFPYSQTLPNPTGLIKVDVAHRMNTGQLESKESNKNHHWSSCTFIKKLVLRLLSVKQEKKCNNIFSQNT